MLRQRRRELAGPICALAGLRLQRAVEHWVPARRAVDHRPGSFPVRLLSKAETERIWLTFGIVANSGLALLRGRESSWALAAAARWAIPVNCLFNTGW